MADYDGHVYCHVTSRKNPEKAIAAMQFFTWGLMHGDRLVHNKDLVRLPDALQAKAFGEMTSMVDVNGQALRWAMK